MEREAGKAHRFWAKGSRRDLLVALVWLLLFPFLLYSTSLVAVQSVTSRVALPPAAVPEPDYSAERQPPSYQPLSQAVVQEIILDDILQNSPIRPPEEQLKKAIDQRVAQLPGLRTPVPAASGTPKLGPTPIAMAPPTPTEEPEVSPEPTSTPGTEPEDSTAPGGTPEPSPEATTAPAPDATTPPGDLLTVAALASQPQEVVTAVSGPTEESHSSSDEGGSPADEEQSLPSQADEPAPNTTAVPDSPEAPASSDGSADSEGSETPPPAPTDAPTQVPEPTETAVPDPTETPAPTATPSPTRTPKPMPTQAPRPAEFGCAEPIRASGRLPAGFVESTTPSSAASGVNLGTGSIVIRFTQPMKSSSGAGGVESLSQYKLHQESNPSKVVKIESATYDSVAHTITLHLDTSDPRWEANTWYDLRIKGGIRNLCDVAQGADVVIRFRTGG